MDDLKKHGWKIAVIFGLYVLASTLDYHDQVRFEQTHQLAVIEAQPSQASEPFPK